MPTRKSKRKAKKIIPLPSKNLQESPGIQPAFEVLYDAVPDGILTTDVKTRRIVSVNPGACKLFGYSPKEFLFKPISKLHPVSEMQKILLQFRQLAQRKKIFASDIPCVKKDGAVFFVDITARPVVLDKRRCVLGLFRDVTERKRTGDALRESEDRFRNLFVNSKEALMTLEPPFWRFSSANVSMMRMFKAKNKAELLSHSPWALSPKRQPDGRASKEKAKEMIRTAMRKGAHFFEWTHRRIDGEAFSAEVLLTRTEKAGKKFLQATVRDIMERKKIEHDLLASETRYRRLFEAAKDGILILNAKTGMINDVNPYLTKLLGYSHKVFLGKKIWELGFFRDIVPNKAHFLRLQQKKYVRYDDMPLETVDGRRINVEFVSNVYQVDNQSVIQCNIRNITERKKVVNELKDTKERLEYILGVTKTGVDVIDAGFNLRYVDPGWQKVYGNPLGRKCFEYFMGRKSVCPGCGIPRALRTRKVMVTEETLPYEGNRKIEVHTIPFRDSDGEWLVAEFNIDITERKRAEETLKEAEDQRNLALRGARMGVWQLDIVENKRHFDKQVCGLLGIDPKTFSGRAEEFFKAVHPEDRAMLKAALARTIAKGVPYEPEYRVVWADKSVHYVAARGKLVRDGEGHPWRIMGVVWDVTERKKAEEASRISEQRLQLQFQRMPIACILWSADFRAMSWNPAAEKIFGYKAREVLGKHSFELIVPRSTQFIVEPIWKRLLKGDETANLVNENITKSGKTILCKWTNTPLHNPDGSILAVLSMAEDITGLRESEKELRLAHFSVDSASDSVFWVDSDGRFLFANDAACRHLGFSKKELLEMKVLDIDPGFSASTWSAHWKELRKKKHMAFESIHKTKQGRLIPVELNINYLPFEGKEYNFSFVRDITKRKRSEDALLQHRLQMRQIIDTVPHMVFAKDRQGRFLLVNRAVATMYGKTPQELIGKKLREVHPVAAELKRSEDADRQVLAMGKPVLIADDIFTDVLGRKHVLQTVEIPFDMAGMKEKAILGVSVDVTEQKKVEEFRNDIIRTVSHELRTPLSIQKEGVNLVLDGTLGPLTPKQEMVLQTVMRSVNRLSRLISGLLDISRIETGKIELRKEKTVLEDLLGDVVFEFQKHFKEKGLEIRLNLPESPTVVLADPDKITQVLTNLIENALKFTERGGAEISLAVMKDEAECTVRDTGMGIAPGNVEKVFEKFRQFGRTDGPGEKGLGLGLSIVKEIIRLHGGRIWAQSELGKGTRVTFVLPLFQRKGAS